MKAKKLLSLVLAILMVMAVAVTAIPTTIFAAGDTTADAANASFKIGNQYYSTLKAALDDAKDGDTIDMLKNVDDPTIARLGTYSKNLTINGNGFTYTAKKNTKQYLFYLEGCKTLTVNNLNMVVQSGLGISGSGGTINLNNCNILSTHRMAIRTSAAKFAEFNLYNTVLEINSDTNKDGAQAEPLVYLDGSDYNILNLTGTSKLIRSTKTTDNTGNCSVINVVTAAGYTEVNVGAQAEIVLNQATGNSNAPHGIYNGGKGLVAVNLEQGATMKIDSAIDATPYFFYGKAAVGFAINDEGANFLVKSGKTPGTYLSDFTVWESVTSPVSGYTAFKPIAPVASGTAAVDAIAAGNVIRYYTTDKAVAYTNNIKTATDGAYDGSVIHVLGDHTQDSAKGLCTVDIRLSYVGYGNTLTLNNNTAGGIFPFIMTKNCTIAGFEKIETTTGGLQVNDAFTVVTNTVFESGNRAAAKMSGGAGTNAYLTIKNAEVCISSSANNEQAAFIFEGNGTATLTLKEGAELRRNNPTKGNYKIQAAVLYAATDKTGTYNINMESGSKMAAAPQSGDATGSIIAFDNSIAKMAINIEEGAYLVSESTVLTTLYFVYAKADAKIKLNTPADAFLAKASVSAKSYNEGIEYGKYTGTFAKKETSAVSGYNQYVLTRGKASSNKFVTVNIFGDTVYVDRFAKALTFSSATVTMLEDVSDDTNNMTVAAGNNVTIDLNGKKYTNTTAAGTYLISSLLGNVTIKNGTLNVCCGFTVKDKGVLTLDGVTGNATLRPYIKLSSGTATANIKDSIITNTASDQNVILIEKETVGTLNVTGNSYVAHKGASAGGTNSAVIQIQGSASATINVGAGVKLGSAYEIESAKWGGVIVDSTTGNVNVTLEAGSELAIERKYAPEYAHFIYERTADGTTTVVDNGATYTVTAESLNSKIYLPKNNAGEGKTFIGFSATNGKFYATGLCEAIGGTETVSFKAEYLTADDFGMIDGASLRTVYKENGIRFSTTYTDALKAAVGNNATFGTLIAPTKVLDGAALTLETEGALNIVSTKSVDGEGVTTYHAAVLMTPEGVAEKDIYTLELAARAYMTITYADGTTATFYAEADDNVRDMYTTAKNLAAAGETNAVIEHIISVCEA